MTARNKELINLGFAAIVASAAFASVSIVGTGLVSARWLGYVGVIFGLYLVAHVVARFTVPYADPTLLPRVGLRTARRLTVIYRRDPDHARRRHRTDRRCRDAHCGWHPRGPLPDLLRRAHGHRA